MGIYDPTDHLMALARRRLRWERFAWRFAFVAFGVLLAVAVYLVV